MAMPKMYLSLCLTWGTETLYFGGNYVIDTQEV
jgi:hypothetical protein